MEAILFSFILNPSWQTGEDRFHLEKLAIQHNSCSHGTANLNTLMVYSPIFGILQRSCIHDYS